MSLLYEYLPATQAAQQELVLLHGWGCNREVWRPLLVELRPWANITLVDLPGCTDATESGVGTDVRKLLARVLERCPARAVFVGWSLGGQLAIELARRKPDRVAGVITLCSNPSFVARGDWPGMSQQAFEAFRADVGTDPAAALQRFDSLQVAGASSPRALLRQLRLLRRVPVARDLLAGLEWLHVLDQRLSLAALTQPQLHVLAAQDALVPANVGQHVATAIADLPSAQVRTLTDTCHLAPLDAPAKVAREIRAFVRDW